MGNDGLRPFSTKIQDRLIYSAAPAKSQPNSAIGNGSDTKRLIGIRLIKFALIILSQQLTLPLGTTIRS
jgi:hypothetical protein